MKGSFLAIGSSLVLFGLSAVSNEEYEKGKGCEADEVPAAMDHSLVVVRNDKGIGFTDFIMQHRTWGCISRTPTLKLDTAPNAKLACGAMGGRLPKLSEVNSLALYMSQNFFEEKRITDKKLLKSKFMTDDRYFWTAKVKESTGPHVKVRAVATLHGLKSSTDRSRAQVQWVGTHLDATEYRPFLCVFDKVN